MGTITDVLRNHRISGTTRHTILSTSEQIETHRTVPLLPSFGVQVRDNRPKMGNPQSVDVTLGTDNAYTATHHSRVQRTYCVYMMASQGRVLYIGITSNIHQRVFQHEQHFFGGFTAKYNVTNLVYFESHGSVTEAIRREKELKGWRREKKIALIERMNPKWRDLSYGWYQVTPLRLVRKSPEHFPC